jgi:hypothetical protein
MRNHQGDQVFNDNGIPFSPCGGSLSHNNRMYYSNNFVPYNGFLRHTQHSPSGGPDQFHMHPFGSQQNSAIDLRETNMVSNKEIHIILFTIV